MSHQELRQLTWEAERFLYREADLLDTRRYEEWLDTLHDELVYFVPIVRNARHNELEQRETTREGEDISWFEEGKWTLGKRIEQIRTGVHWAEEPVSRVVHLVTNVYVTSVDEIEGGVEIGVSSRVLIRQNRNQYENIVLAARRQDVLRKIANNWFLLRREAKLTENVLTAKMLTTIL
ncbi:MAG: 3-phenylpropionate/cinnamic acid dioxygenase subunit beta [Pigmentiphaga sp.]